MSQEDPFALPDSDRTFMMPSPGGRTPRRIETVATASATSTDVTTLEALTPSSGFGPLLGAASPLLNLVPQLRATLQHPNPAELREALAQGIRSFESRAKGAGISPEKVIAARYALCTLLDETAASTPWGGSGAWANQSLLVLFHNETWGGEKFFQLLAKLAENAAANRDLLELMYICLALGFEGRYRVVENGRSQLEGLRERLFQLLRGQHTEYERELSAHWKGTVETRGKILANLPLWVIGAVIGVLLLTLYFAFSFSLNRSSDPAFAAIQAIRIKDQSPARISLPALAAKPRLASFLAPEIEARLIAVDDEGDRSIITIRGDGLFDAGSATISEKVQPLLARIADALNSVQGNVLVTGHTDSQPIRSARFPSNWHLSQERANSVAQQLATAVHPSDRIKAEGRADAEPIAPNTTPAERARNRRVEITLFVANTVASGASR